jgi:cellulose synthase/poly-beta-1,6-N-acetylglucosamine synthase-like glycosyltransferase
MLGVAACLVFLVPATGACLYYLALTLAGILPARMKQYTRRPGESHRPVHSFVILIPAHNEETTLPATFRSIAALDYPAGLVRVVVVADNCTDRTAEVAREGGAICLVRDDREHCGKGFAVAVGVNRLAESNSDIVLILDADCTLRHDALRELDATFVNGADVVQAAVWSRNADDGPGGYVAAVGAAVDDALAAGWERFGRSVPLRGTGMAFRRVALGRVKWATSSPVEDVEYALQVQATGGRVWFCRRAVVSCDAPTGVDALCRQRRRWREAVRVGGWVASKPLVLMHLLVTVAVCTLLGLFLWWAAGLATLTAGLYLRAAARIGFTRRRVGLLFRSPGVVARLAWVVLAGVLEQKTGTWDRTPRLGERPAE